jgi:hypothetical protein
MDSRIPQQAQGDITATVKSRMRPSFTSAPPGTRQLCPLCQLCQRCHPLPSSSTRPVSEVNLPAALVHQLAPSEEGEAIDVGNVLMEASGARRLEFFSDAAF